MRCDKMHATISVKQCLSNQGRFVADVHHRIQGAIERWYPGCVGCATGELARAGELNDDDLQALFAGPHARAEERSGRTPIISEARNTNHENGGNMEEKQCKWCKKVKPLDDFSRKTSYSERRRNVCKECVKAYQRDWKARKIDRQRMEAEEKSEPRKIEQKTAEVRNARMEPAPRQETPAPVMPQNEDQILENQLLLDFSCYPEVLEEIKRIAHHEERPLEVQARYMLKRVLQDGWGETRP